MLSFSTEKAEYRSSNKKRYIERIENLYEEKSNIVGTSNTKQVASVLKYYTQKMTTLYCESLLLSQLKK